uniref:Uncharacterized protein n=1 Tax=Anguilla anguilla TaxID=7936 RepID=A0A0E9STD3_ANGAN
MSVMKMTNFLSYRRTFQLFFFFFCFQITAANWFCALPEYCIQYYTVLTVSSGLPLMSHYPQCTFIWERYLHCVWFR